MSVSVSAPVLQVLQVQKVVVVRPDTHKAWFLAFW